jgi:hypothetical protein
MREKEDSLKNFQKSTLIHLKKLVKSAEIKHSF